MQLFGSFASDKRASLSPPSSTTQVQLLGNVLTAQKLT